ncbi:carboxypeptidase-like regulatory domain-containing protein [Cellulophaga baltica]|uniref:TonB-dependent receptor n=1 Tax=Cellulophaga baltica TaxID=76594 RepID=UPI002149878D|nr:carboxypeptidase regulatory-like domain-containing protein [Cellulophaga baltica]MCR1025667.1 carboxypeptidase-like regulatory domain-containing protein [Cellulophaga baltica]
MKNYFLKNRLRWKLTTKLSILMILGTVLLSYGQSTNATIKGKVTDANDEPLMGATIIVKNVSTGFTSGSISNIDGNYQLQQLPLGGPYTVTAQYLGFEDVVNKEFMLNLSDVINVNFIMKESATNLDEVVVSSNSLAKRVQQLGASTKISAGQIDNLPTEGRNFTRLTSLSPLQGGGAINLGGQRRTSTNVTIDGVNFRNTLTAGEIGGGPYTISQEAIREFEVVTNDYDVTQGRQGGGAITAVTKSGTNEFKGSAFFYHRADELQSDFTIQGEDREADFYNSQYGLSVGGPLIKDKLHFFLVYERQDAGDPQFIANIQSDADANRLGITEDNLNRFLQIGRDNYGLSDSKQVGQFDRVTEANNLFLRLDWQINNKHRLTLRNLYNKWENPLSVSDNSNIELAESYSDFTSEENSTLLSLRSVFSSNITNEFKVQYQHAERIFSPNSELPSQNIPRAIVQVASILPNENNRTISVQLGGQRFTPETNLENQVQVANTTYINAGKFNFTLGTDNLITYLETQLSNEQNGRFFFDSLDDFENLNPSRYAREVPLQGSSLVKQTVLDLSFFGQVEFDINPNLNLVAGVRYDATAFLDAAEFNPLVFQELGIRTDEKPEDFNNIQPRLQLTYNLKGKDTDIFKLGAGVFSAQPHYYAQVNNIQNSGTLLGAIDVTGSNVPTPDFTSYRNDPSTAPGVPAGVTPFSTINAVSSDFEVPTIYKANLSYTHFFGDRYSLGINSVFSHTTNNYVYQEANLVSEPFFVTPQGREVFVPASTIPENGSPDWTNSRISDLIGRTLVLSPDAVSDNIALIFEGSAIIGQDGYLNASYTINRSKDNSSYNCCVANTSTFLPVKGDPRDLNYGFSDNHFGSKLVVNGATPTWKGFNFGATIIGEGGSRYTFEAGGNRSANGDFNLSNELAYVFDPNDPNTPQDIIDGYNQILNDPDTPDNFKDYLRESFGDFADRNGGKNPFRATVDLRLQKKFSFNKNKHGLQLSADVFNFMNLLNKEWGRTNNYGGGVNVTNITGFDQASNSYQYNVQTGSGTEPINGTPWRLQLGARYTFN